MIANPVVSRRSNIFTIRALQLEQELQAFMHKCRKLHTNLVFVTPYMKNIPEIVSVQKCDPFAPRFPDPSKLLLQYFQRERPVLIFDWKGMEEFPTREYHDPRGAHNGCREL